MSLISNNRNKNEWECKTDTFRFLHLRTEPAACEAGVRALCVPQNVKKRNVSVLLALVFLLFPPVTHATGSLSVSVTPPLFQLTIGPGESWSSVLKVVNNNPYDVTYYSQAVDFAPKGEDGTSTFIPIIEELNDPLKQAYSLASWLEISAAPVMVPAGGSGQIPFTVHVPMNAEPGGHYGAILVGTQPAGALKASGPLVKVSSYVSSLLFVRIKGDVSESGRIREFTAGKIFYQTPRVDLGLRFENIGNTHLRPEGDITIYNMWGKERGKILINQENGNFGNVLPRSIRKFDFSWEGESGLFEVGPYSAVVTINYGEDGKKNVSAKTYFWVVPIIPLAIGVGTLLLTALLAMWLIRRYIHRTLSHERIYASVTHMPAHAMSEEAQGMHKVPTSEVKADVIDLRSRTDAPMHGKK